MLLKSSRLHLQKMMLIQFIQIWSLLRQFDTSKHLLDFGNQPNFKLNDFLYLMPPHPFFFVMEIVYDEFGKFNLLLNTSTLLNSNL